MDKFSQLITTLKDKCKLCYTCVRDCPAKAIRILDGQAEVIKERCIGCGNCVRVCSQNAKEVYSSIDEVKTLIKSKSRTAAIVAPSFPAEFSDMEPGILVAMLKKVGFDIVSEVAFGADLVASEYKKLLKENDGKSYIATTCPGIALYVMKHMPQLVPFLAPIVSPMVATARVLKKVYGEDLKIVFIGPCLAKKVEAVSIAEDDEIKSALTFRELREFFKRNNLDHNELKVEEVFDLPVSGLGTIFPVGRGMFQAAGLTEDILHANITAVDGRHNSVRALNEFLADDLQVELLEALCCHGCIMGSGMSVSTSQAKRHSQVSKYAQKRIAEKALEKIEKAVPEVDLRISFKADDSRLKPPTEKELKSILKKMGKIKEEDELDCGACGYLTCREHANAIFMGLAENEMCLPYTIERLRTSLNDLQLSKKRLAHTKQDLNVSKEMLASAQEALFNAQKLASMGQLSAGIAHEINNPLGVILLYANLLKEDSVEGSDQREDLDMILEQAERCKKIVSGLLNFARRNKVIYQDTDIHQLLENCMKSIKIPDNINFELDFGMVKPVIEVDPDQIIQVLTNLMVNAIEAMHDGGKIILKTESDKDNLIITISDTGTGIPEEYLPRIFEPLFTTKQIGKGTGLGLAVIYGIIKMHKGRIDVKSNADSNDGPTGTTFTVVLPMHPE